MLNQSNSNFGQRHTGQESPQKLDGPRIRNLGTCGLGVCRLLLI